MAVNTAPIFIDAGSIGAVTVSTANTGRDGSGTIADLVGTSTDGERVDRLEATARGPTTAGMLRFFIHDGSVWRFWFERFVTATTPNATTISPWRMTPVQLSNNTVTDGAFILPATHKIGVAPNNAEEFEVFAFGGVL